MNFQLETVIFKTSDGKVAETTDGFDNFVSRLGLNNHNTLSTSVSIRTLT